jgi:hypothetical protein
MKNKITTKKIKLVAKKVSNETGVFMKKAGKNAGNMAGRLQKEWKKEQPQREELMSTANKALEHGIKIGGDVFETIKKDINEINNQNNKKNKK